MQRLCRNYEDIMQLIQFSGTVYVENKKINAVPAIFIYTSSLARRPPADPPLSPSHIKKPFPPQHPPALFPLVCQPAIAWLTSSPLPSLALLIKKIYVTLKIDMGILTHATFLACD